MPVWSPGVDITQDCLPENKFLKVVYSRNVRLKLFVVGTSKLFLSKEKIANHT